MNYYSPMKTLTALHYCRDAEKVFRMKNNNVAADKMKEIIEALEAATKEIQRLQELSNEDDIPF